MSLGTAGSADGGQGAAGASGGAGNPGGVGNGNAGNAGSSGNGAGMGAAGGGSASWRDSLPEDIRANPSISSYADVVSLAKSHIHAQSVIGRKGAIPPLDWKKATPEETSSFFKAIGVPEGDKYEVASPQNIKIPDEFLGKFKSEAVKLNLLPHQASGMLDWWAKLDLAQTGAKSEAQKLDVQKGLSALKSEWGEAYDQNLRVANAFVKENGTPELNKLFADPAISNHPALIKLLVSAGKMMTEDKLRESGAGSEGGETKSEIQSQLDELRGNGMSNGLFDKSHPMHAVSVEKLASLSRRLTGGK